MNNISIIVAMDRQRGIGLNGRIPWRLQNDMSHFKNVTKGRVVVMGRKTYESLPEKVRPLPDRVNLILTRNKSFKAPGCKVTTFDDVLNIAVHQEIYIIGGEEIYNMFIGESDRLLITHVETIVHGDRFFPHVEGKWNSRILHQHDADERNEFPFTIIEYKRK